MINDGTIQLSVSGSSNKDVLVVLTDVLGKEIYSKVIVNESGNYLISINPDKKMPSGLYFITASSSDKYVSKKFVVK